MIITGSTAEWTLSTHRIVPTVPSVDMPAEKQEGMKTSNFVDASRKGTLLPSRTSTAGTGAPASFYCPISMELMADPVMVATGHTYDRCWTPTGFMSLHCSTVFLQYRKQGPCNPTVEVSLEMLSFGCDISPLPLFTEDKDLMAELLQICMRELGNISCRLCIERWLAQGNRTCPVTGMRLRHLELTPNFALRNAIQVSFSFQIGESFMLRCISKIQDHRAASFYGCNLDPYLRFSKLERAISRHLQPLRFKDSNSSGVLSKLEHYI